MEAESGHACNDFFFLIMPLSQNGELINFLSRRNKLCYLEIIIPLSQNKRLFPPFLITTDVYQR